MKIPAGMFHETGDHPEEVLLVHGKWGSHERPHLVDEEMVEALGAALPVREKEALLTRSFEKQTRFPLDESSTRMYVDREDLPPMYGRSQRVAEHHS
jgi:hypothetical protein